MAFAKNKPYKRTRNLFNPQSQEPFKLSRSRLENFVKCPRCFYLDRRLGVEPPGMPAFTLNSAVDELLKKEFDGYRRERKAHPLMVSSGVEAIPFAHPMIDEWREVFKGVQYHHRPTNFILFGAVDDIWVDKAGTLYIVDYKSTSTSEPITLDNEYRQAYKRQMEIYQWLLRKQNLKVSDTGYFVYCNADKSKGVFGGRLEFGLEIIPYKGSDGWVEEVVLKAHKCLLNNELPDFSDGCEYCQYRKAAGKIEEIKPNHPHQTVKGPQGELF